MTDSEVQRILIALARIEEQLKGLKDDVENLNGFRDWAIKLVVGAVILGLVGLLWAQGR